MKKWTRIEKGSNAIEALFPPEAKAFSEAAKTTFKE